MDSIRVGSRICAEITAYAPCTIHKHWAVRGRLPRLVPLSTQFCGCEPVITAHAIRENDLETKQLAQLMLAGTFASTQATVKDTSAATHSIANGFTSGTFQVVAGTGTTAAACLDFVLQAQSAGSSGFVAATINAYVDAGTTGSFTVTGTITNGSGSTITYGEIGIYLTIATFIYMVCHDIINGATGFPVSNNGTLAVTYTITNS